MGLGRVVDGCGKRALSNKSNGRSALGMRSYLAKNLGGEHRLGRSGRLGCGRGLEDVVHGAVDLRGFENFDLLATTAVLRVVLGAAGQV